MTVEEVAVPLGAVSVVAVGASVSDAVAASESDMCTAGWTRVPYACVRTGGQTTCVRNMCARSHRDVCHYDESCCLLSSLRRCVPCVELYGPPSLPLPRVPAPTQTVAGAPRLHSVMPHRLLRTKRLPIPLPRRILRTQLRTLGGDGTAEIQI